MSAASIGSRSLSYEEAFALMRGLLLHSDSLFYMATHNMDSAMSMTNQLLIANHNRIVDSIPVDKKNKQQKEKAKLELPKKIVKKKQLTPEQATKRMAFSGIATE